VFGYPVTNISTNVVGKIEVLLHVLPQARSVPTKQRAGTDDDLHVGFVHQGDRLSVGAAFTVDSWSTTGLRGNVWQRPLASEFHQTEASVNAPGKHRFVLEALADTLGTPLDRIAYFQQLRDLRHRDICEGSIHVSDREADDAVGEASLLLVHLRSRLEARAEEPQASTNALTIQSPRLQPLEANLRWRGVRAPSTGADRGCAASLHPRAAVETNRRG
jgi:hypothetical protein